VAIRRRNGKWVFDFYHNGSRIVRTIKHARTQKEAEQAEAVIKSDAYRQTYGLEGKKDSPFEQFVIDSYLPYAEANKRTFYDDVKVCKVLIEFLGRRMMRSITPVIVEELKRKRMATPLRSQKDRVAKHWTPRTASKRQKQRSEESNEPLKQRKPATVNRELSVLSKIFSLAVDAEILDDNPCRRVKKLRVANQRVRYLSHSEEEELLNALDGAEWVRNIVAMALNTGMRRGELFDLKWFDVDLSRRVVHVRQSKSGRPRMIPLNTAALELLGGLPKASEYVFPSPKNGGRVNDVGRQFERAVNRAGLVDFHFHDLRHTAATRMADSGVDPFTLAAILGHSDIRMTARYTHATDKAMRRAVETLVDPERYGRRGDYLVTNAKTASTGSP
jgi:integrase